MKIFVKWLEKSGTIFSPLFCFINKLGNKRIDLAMAMNHSSAKYYMRELHPKVETTTSLLNVILGMTHFNKI